ncbi:MAG: hypothetical protein QF921_02895 [Pseudomonadales bacterium]|jgi:hypothetical protein|nr:hypothetical protein [Pseudomonadales bacterium]MDP6471184.1 hypothetical protein [Pseudomonadales bacterium]MDP6825629.1 hypothetical protein [Pseudomonadales bacterium]MDP6970456.1 hypothetical protein [Pseudomonadales bacterium]|tara:strand:+ start:3202 stop:3594 length:393 start_codon:yes stop_codon:yes gene_type:complete
MGKLVSNFTDDVETVVEKARALFGDMLNEMAYLENPQHPMAAPLFMCNVNLALYLALKDEGVDVHDFGTAMLKGLARAPSQGPQFPEDPSERAKAYTGFLSMMEETQRNTKPGEFVLKEATQADPETAWG